MLRIAVCDDHIPDLEQTHQAVLAYCQLHPQRQLEVRRFQSAYDLVESIETRGGYDVYLLDILMPHTDGITLGEHIRRSDTRAAILYLTSSTEFALRSYTVQAEGYLVKPVDNQKLFDTLGRVLSRLDSDQERSIVVKTAEGMTRVRLSEIVFVEYQAHRCHYRLADGRTVGTVALREPFYQAAAPLLADDRFYKVSASFIVSLQYVETIGHKGLCMTDGTPLPVSRPLYKAVKAAYLDFLLQRGLAPR